MPLIQDYQAYSAVVEVDIGAILTRFVVVIQFMVVVEALVQLGGAGFLNMAARVVVMPPVMPPAAGAGVQPVPQTVGPVPAVRCG